MTGPAARFLADGRRLHLQHGPIDLVIGGFGPAPEIAAAYRQARQRFATVLDGLVAELPRLRRVCRAADPGFRDSIATRMAGAVMPYAPAFITPMAAVAGAVADEVLGAMCGNRRLEKAYVNNGGDIALYLGEGGSFDIGLVSDPALARLAGRFSLSADQPVRGIATSGRHGRSLSLGIADSVTVLASAAALADAAATMIANAVDLPGSAKIRRCPARRVDPDSDLGDRMVTIGVERLSPAEIDAALGRGERYAETLVGEGRILAAALTLDGRFRLVSGLPAAPALATAEGPPQRIARPEAACG